MDITDKTDAEYIESTEVYPHQPKWVLLSPMKDQPLSLNQISERASRVKQRLFDSSKDRGSIAAETSDQQTCRDWYDVRQQE